MKLVDMKQRLREHPEEINAILESATKERDQAVRLAGQEGRDPTYRANQQKRADNLDQFMLTAVLVSATPTATPALNHDAAYSLYKDYERLRKERVEMRDEGFRKWLRKQSPDTFTWLTENQPLPEITRRDPAESNRPEDYL